MECGIRTIGLRVCSKGGYDVLGGEQMYFKDDEPEVPTDPIDRVLQLQSIMIDRVTYFRGGPEAVRLYGALRASLMRDDALRTRLPQAVRVCRMLDDLWDFIQPNFPTYASRRSFFREEFDSLITYLENLTNNPSSEILDGSFSDFSVAGVQNLWNKASERIEQDPEGAITAARSLIESVCKHVLDEAGEQYGDLDNIYRQASRLLGLAPDERSEQSFRQLSGACNSIVGSLNEIRNRFGDAHGRSGSDAAPLPRHAELAVNVAGSLAIFIMRTKIEQSRAEL